MHISKSVEILVLVEHLISLLLVVTVVVIHEDNLALALFVKFLKFKILTSLILDSLDKLTFHGRLTREVTNATIVILILATTIIDLVAIIGHVFVRADVRLLLLRGTLSKGSAFGFSSGLFTRDARF